MPCENKDKPAPAGNASYMAKTRTDAKLQHDYVAPLPDPNVTAPKKGGAGYRVL